MTNTVRRITFVSYLKRALRKCNACVKYTTKMETKIIPTLKERYKSLNTVEKMALRLYVMDSAGCSRETFYRYVNEPQIMKARAFEAFCTYFDVLSDELLPQPESQPV